jgi:hypothetical protein
MLSADYIRSLLPVSTPLSAAEIAEHIPQALRDASVFSARTVYAEHISATQADIAQALDGKTSAADVRGLMKLRLRRLGYAPDPADAGGLKDLSSDERTSLIVNMQMQRASGYAKWRSDQDPAILDAFPGQEMFRAGSPKVPRDWPARWDTARAELGASTSATPSSSGFYALKNDPIWSQISRFGSPYPPFDYGSSMRVRNVGRRQCRALGLLADAELADDLLRPARDPMDGNVTSSSAAGMDPELVRAWVNSFGDRARLYTGRDGLPRVAVAPPPSAAVQIADAVKAGSKASADFAFAPDAVAPAGTTLRVSAADIPGADPADIAALPRLLKSGKWSAESSASPQFTAADGTRITFRRSGSALIVTSITRPG